MTRYVLSDHAIRRYRQRVGSRKTPVRVIQSVLEGGRFQPQRPANIAVARAMDEQPDGYVIAGEAVFPVNRAHDDKGQPVLVAMTCLRVAKRSKAERRALRELAREEEMDLWAA